MSLVRGKVPAVRVSCLTAAAAAGLLALAACGSAAGSASTGSGGMMHASGAGANPNVDPGSSLGGRVAPDIRLDNQFGQPMALSQFRGKVVILAFTDSQCTNICPLTTSSMLAAKHMLGKAGNQVQLLGVDANPRATSVSDVMSYSRSHGLVNQWDFLTGSLPQLEAVWRSYHIAVQINQGQIDHTPALYVIDQRGHERELYLTQMSFAAIGQAGVILAREAASLLPGHPAVHSGSLALIPGYPPSARTVLPTVKSGNAGSGSAEPGSVKSGSVRFGPGAARLTMFFATWLSETSDLRSHLLALNAYVKAAQGGRLPALAAVDEGTTEPSQDAAAAFIAGLGQPLAYPVAADPTGRLADGYGVQDQPWFTLTSPAGKIIWHHDGWLSLTALKAAARKA